MAEQVFAKKTSALHNVNAIAAAPQSPPNQCYQTLLPRKNPAGWDPPFIFLLNPYPVSRSTL